MAANLDLLRQELILQLNGGNAHAPFEKAVGDFPSKYRGVVPPGLPYSSWQLLEHMRLAQADMLEFCANRNYKEKKWPADYWPKSPAPASTREWDTSIRNVKKDRAAFIKLISHPDADLFQPLPWGTG